MNSKWQLIRKHSGDQNSVFMADGSYNEIRKALKAEFDLIMGQALSGSRNGGGNITQRDDRTFKGLTMWDRDGAMVYGISLWIERQ